ncbi:MAG: uncharacterized protein QOJ98_1493 [Acidobacteriota bacterium]|jgi:hypothetical protein|nr:uncharacterized protein [Acidobacteriota bacterium]
MRTIHASLLAALLLCPLTAFAGDDPEAGAVQPTDAAAKAEAIAFLQSRDLGVSFDQLQMSAIEGKPDEVEALIAAGVDPNAGDAADSPLVGAMHGCSSEGETEVVMATVAALLKGGADVKRADDNKNTPLMTAAQFCGPGVIGQLLEAGADISPRNGSGMTPLSLAMIMSHWEAAEALIEKGARLTDSEAQIVANSVSDERVKGILKKATAKKN